MSFALSVLLNGVLHPFRVTPFENVHSLCIYITHCEDIMILYDAIQTLSSPGEMVQWIRAHVLKVGDTELKFPSSTYKRTMYACAYNPSVRGRDKWILTASWTVIQGEMPSFGFSESLSQKVW